MTREYVACSLVYYSSVFRRCGHLHPTVADAEACRVSGSFSRVEAVDYGRLDGVSGRLFPLTDTEQAQLRELRKEAKP
ncbi:MAG: hypothetical protein OXH75_15620 [Acidobacteria bacterium]|nr:hypothetical protein [Acidobacteriota bacterium]